MLVFVVLNNVVASIVTMTNINRVTIRVIPLRLDVVIRKPYDPFHDPDAILGIT